MAGDAGSGTGWLSAVCLTPDGQRVWAYSYRRALGAAYDIACGNDDRVYVAGPTLATNNWVAFTVVCLESGVATEEGVALRRSHVASPATVVRDMLWLPQAASCLRDAAGRRVLDLRAGANDVSRLAPGVYFIGCQPSFTGGRPPTTTRIVVTK
ncbi:hypothetical protein FJY69_00245 [candidate division WOR-3 bacterium]|nr:hypothetical protein [candidate division WOR-3 bacterium]